MSEIFGIGTGAIYTRINKYGWSVEDAVSRDINEKISKIRREHEDVKRFVYKNEKLTLRAFSEKYDLYLGTLVSRIQNGWSIEKAIETPIRKPNEYEFGDSKLKISDISKINGLTNAGNFRGVKDGNRLEGSKYESVKLDKVMYRDELLSLKELSKKVNVSYYVLRDRLKAGWSLEDAISKPVKSRK